METKTPKRTPYGNASFEKVSAEICVYVDKARKKPA